MLISGATKLYGIIGNPVRHSLSPYMHNAAFEELNLDCVYVAFEVDSVSCVMDAVKCLGISGLSVTAPFKEDILEYLDEIDEAALKIGAVNTIKYDGKRTAGINTDWIGAIRALERKTSLESKRCMVVGAGGTARALVYGLKKRQARVVIINRTLSRARELAGEFNVDFGALKDIRKFSVDVLVNTTTVGMEPDHDMSLVPADYLQNISVVMDVIYKPRMTKLLIDAQAAGCKVVEGLEMLLEQGIAQFEWWTGKKAPRDKMARAIGLTYEEK